ncbi:hypothetical protein BOTBODRAFT_559146 [Botryobasidium botryosum FD-172 SS1]|uniref:Uncharacterized protein n=1 Tax=Botryobasidium botryosum (strain FD-172 SS1) TaxID=930990 RepID=A0A067M295_BOTB1|nr:hypothetical protein BOTBODRAFT_559146 [Botryobasidium botryosum FD-172 SS1]
MPSNIHRRSSRPSKGLPRSCLARLLTQLWPSFCGRINLVLFSTSVRADCWHRFPRGRPRWDPLPPLVRPISFVYSP